MVKISVLRVPGFGDAMTGNLLDWRRKIESSFRYNPARNTQDISDEGILRADFTRRKGEIEATIRNGLQVLRAAKPKIVNLKVRAGDDEALMRVLENRLRAEQDLKILGAPVPNADMKKRGVLEPRLAPKH